LGARVNPITHKLEFVREKGVAYFYWIFKREIVRFSSNQFLGTVRLLDLYVIG
jgi:hypothetical protein